MKIYINNYFKQFSFKKYFIFLFNYKNIKFYSINDLLLLKNNHPLPSKNNYYLRFSLSFFNIYKLIKKNIILTLSKSYKLNNVILFKFLNFNTIFVKNEFFLNSKDIFKFKYKFVQYLYLLLLLK